jgi:hypothetical protein
VSGADEVVAMFARVQEMLRPKMAVAMNPLDVTDAVRRECKARNVPLRESSLVERGKAFVMDLEKLEAEPTGQDRPRDPDTGLPISGWGIDYDRSHPPEEATGQRSQ